MLLCRPMRSAPVDDKCKQPEEIGLAKPVSHSKGTVSKSERSIGNISVLSMLTENGSKEDLSGRILPLFTKTSQNSEDLTQSSTIIPDASEGFAFTLGLTFECTNQLLSSGDVE
ncbi:unnamed protein product [Hymenolepis diminuta]|uniref:Uncharacterized protein n=1 Tax=Hymenolepis diminuta TaxID=6216 RepID=A0A564Y9T9_HYMDI|nr:unnamed protein product [Hymenolepis diminuta]